MTDKEALGKILDNHIAMGAGTGKGIYAILINEDVFDQIDSMWDRLNIERQDNFYEQI